MDNNRYNESQFFLGGGAFAEKINNKGMIFFGISIVLLIIVIVFIVLLSIGKLSFAKSSMVSSFGGKENAIGNNPNWNMGGFDSGAGGSLDDGTGNCLNWGAGCKSRMMPMPNARSHMNPGNRLRFAPAPRKSNFREHLDNNDPAAVAAAAAAGMPIDTTTLSVNAPPSTDPNVVAAQNAATQAYLQSTNQVVANQNQVLASCSSPWDTKATEEAQVLNSIGVYRSPTPGMSGFIRTINGNTTLTDSQLETIMQGGEPFGNPSPWNFGSSGQQLAATSTMHG